MGERYAQLDWQQIESRRDQCRLLEQEQPWQVSSANFLMLPQILPSSEQTASQYDELNQGLVLGGSIEQYIDVHAKDPHLLQPLLQIREAVRDQGFDVNNNVTTSVSLKP